MPLIDSLANLVIIGAKIFEQIHNNLLYQSLVHHYCLMFQVHATLARRITNSDTTN